MAFGKSEEEKARRKAEKEAAQEAARQQAEEAQQRAAAARAREAYLRTPLGQADGALERGDMFFQFHAPLSKLQGPHRSVNSRASARRPDRSRLAASRQCAARPEAPAGTRPSRRVKRVCRWGASDARAA
jgi:hypothetical protein